VGLTTQHRDRSFRAVFQKHQTTDPRRSLLWALAPQAQLRVSPSAHALTGFFWQSTYSLVPKELQLLDFLRVSRHFFLPEGALPRGIPGTQPQAGDCRFRLLFSAQLSCLCPLPSCSNRTPQHEFSVHVQLLIQTGPFPNFGLGRFSVRPPFFNATENTQFPFRRRSTCKAGNTGAVRRTT